MAARQDQRIKYLKERMSASNDRQAKHVEGFDQTAIRVMAKLEEEDCDCSVTKCHCDPPKPPRVERETRKTMRVERKDDSWLSLKEETEDALREQEQCGKDMRVLTDSFRSKRRPAVGE